MKTRHPLKKIKRTAHSAVLGRKILINITERCSTCNYIISRLIVYSM